MPLGAAIQNRLNLAQVTNIMPAWTILTNANFLPPIPNSAAVIGDAAPQALRKLMKSYYDYGRLHWTWAQSANAAAANGGLVKGAISAVACGSFNQNFKWLAENGLGITGITNGQDPSQFLTIPGATCIDSKWVGNVRTAKEAFSSMKCFKFSGHYWVIHGGINYDVCYNNTFHATSEIIWTKLLDPDPKLQAKAGPGGRVFKLEKPVPTGDHLIMLQQIGPNNWPSWQIVSTAELKALK